MFVGGTYPRIYLGVDGRVLHYDQPRCEFDRPILGLALLVVGMTYPRISMGVGGWDLPYDLPGCWWG